MTGWRNLFVTVMTAVMTVVSGGAVVAQSQGSAVPPSWSSYAGLVGWQFQAWMMGDDEVAYRFHKYLEDRLVSARDTPLPSLVVKVWINHDGQVSRVDFPSLGDEQADDDLRHLLTSQPLSEPPPPEMRQPLMLRLKLAFKS